MTSNTDTQPDSPEPLPLLIAALPPRVLLDIIKADNNLCKTVLQGFSARPATLAHGVVRGRLEQDMIRYPELAAFFFNTWKEIYAGLLADLNAADFMPDGLSLCPLLQTYGKNVLHYGLLHADRAEVRAWADRLEEIGPPVCEVAEPPPPDVTDTAQPSAPHGRLEELQRELQIARDESAAAKHELTELRQKYQLLSTRESDLRRQYETAEARLEREGRRARRAEENAAALRKQLKQAEAQAGLAAEPAPPSELVAAVEEALAALQRGLGRLPAPEWEALPPLLPTPQDKPARRAPLLPPSEDTVISLPAGRAKHNYQAGQIRQAIALNDEVLLKRVRDGLAKLAKTPEKEREAVGTLVNAGIPTPLLTGPLHPAVVDGSNIANMSRSSRGKLAYLAQIRRAAWEEGYFPVITIVDASLRYQIDQPDELMAMIERGEIRMAPPGTSADVLLIEEAKARNAVMLTNDRMTNWPDARKLEKRHVVMDRDRVHLGNFHNSAQWF